MDLFLLLDLPTPLLDLHPSSRHRKSNKELITDCAAVLKLIRMVITLTMAKGSKFALNSTLKDVEDNALTRMPINATCVCKTAILQPAADKLNLSPSHMALLLTPARARERAKAGERNMARAEAEVDKLHKAMIPSLTRLT